MQRVSTSAVYRSRLQNMPQLSKQKVYAEELHTACRVQFELITTSANHRRQEQLQVRKLSVLDCRTQMSGGTRARFVASGETHWICSECKKYPRCNCGKAMPKQRRKGFLKSNDKTYTCADCAAEQKMRSTRQRHT